MSEQIAGSLFEASKLHSPPQKLGRTLLMLSQLLALPDLRPAASSPSHLLSSATNLILNLVALMVDVNIPDIKHCDTHEQIQADF
ncbi:hypothetical protein F4604DRAFT_1916969 [Suillus subluteus]|nr:hypothetical protein F4604DRAFT_1916969 [Suillus subluteus]